MTGSQTAANVAGRFYIKLIMMKEDKKLIEELFLNTRILEIMIKEFYQEHKNDIHAGDLLKDYKEYFGISEERHGNIDWNKDNNNF